MTLPTAPADWPDTPPAAPPTAPAGGDPTVPLERHLPPPAGVPMPSALRPDPPAPTPEAPSGPAATQGPRWRDGLGIAQVAVAAALLALANAAVWVDETGNDPATYEEARLLDLEEGGLSGLIRERLTAVLMDWAAVPERVDAVLPGPLSLLGGPAESLTHRVVDEAIGATLALPEVDALIERVEATADDELTALLFDESEWLRLDGTTVVLDLDPLVLEASYRIDQFIPDWAADAVPALRADRLIPDRVDGSGLELALGEVPVVLEARTAMDGLADPAPRLLLFGAALGVVGLAVARRRLLVVASGGVALAVAALVVGTGWPVEPVFGDQIALLQEVAGQSFVAADGDGLRERSLPLVGAGAALAATGALAAILWSRRTLGAAPDPAA